MTNTKTVLVTGGAGYIGSHVCKALSHAGYTPVTYDNMQHGHEYAVQWGPLEVGDILDRQRLDQVFKQYQPSAVLHFAALISAGESVEDPARYYVNNVTGGLKLLEAARTHGISRIVFSSTAAVYGDTKAEMIAEDHPLQPANPYGHTKLMIEQALQDYDVAYGLKSISLRYFNAAGADVDGDTGEDHEPETHLIPLVLDAAAGRRPQITIYGSDYDTPDGTCIRDYIHVADLADAHVLALRDLEQGASSTAYNLGNGNGFSVSEIIASAKRVTGRDIPVQWGERRPGDPPRLVADSSRICQALGWNPRHNRIDDIILSAWRWHQSR